MTEPPVHFVSFPCLERMGHGVRYSYGWPQVTCEDCLAWKVQIELLAQHRLEDTG